MIPAFENTLSNKKRKNLCLGGLLFYLKNLYTSFSLTKVYDLRSQKPFEEQLKSYQLLSSFNSV